MTWIDLIKMILKNQLYSSVNCYLTPRLTFLVKVVFLNVREMKD